MGHCHIKHCNHPFVNYHFLIFNLRKDNSFFGNEQVYYSNLISASLVKFALYEICSAEGLSLPSNKTNKVIMAVQEHIKALKIDESRKIRCVISRVGNVPIIFHL